MAQEGQEENNREDLTDEASPYRLEEFRRQGRVAQSKELSSLIGLAAAGLAVYAMSAPIAAQLSDFMREIFHDDWASKLELSTHASLFPVLTKSGSMTVFLALPAALAAFFIGGISSFAQIGSIFSTEPLTPDFSRINPLKGFQRFISLKQLLDAVRLVFRTAVVAIVAYVIIKEKVLISQKHVLNDPAALGFEYLSVGSSVFLALVASLLVFAVIDLALQKWEYGKSLRLTKQEVKQEQKEHEGDPLIKARVRSIQRELARRRMMEAVKTADVVVTNPTHIAVALKYQKEEMEAPKVIAKGADLIAQKIKKIAGDAGIPLVENVALARTLFKTVAVGKLVPRALYQAVAEVLAYVYRIRRKSL